ncbi:hypothetical protein EX30DRAFT_242308 [Ascodesmis nigricans]|uniref:Uncharacterized protein n=1 Tax=Ascodesmis nigricans TaxID=341454 RepID=A0A4S2MZ26_9PEZI|nr:hypothetical protein EX30DRAFT_242308 [Ascodesmis nigricans]
MGEAEPFGSEAAVDKGTTSMPWPGIHQTLRRRMPHPFAGLWSLISTKCVDERWKIVHPFPRAVSWDVQFDTRHRLFQSEGTGPSHVCPAEAGEDCPGKSEIHLGFKERIWRSFHHWILAHEKHLESLAPCLRISKTRSPVGRSTPDLSENRTHSFQSGPAKSLILLLDAGLTFSTSFRVCQLPLGDTVIFFATWFSFWVRRMHRDDEQFLPSIEVILGNFTTDRGETTKQGEVTATMVRTIYRLR